MYYLRCKMLHQHDKHTATIFFTPMADCFVSKDCGGVIGTEVGLVPAVFALELVAAARSWRIAKGNDPDVQRRMTSLMQLYDRSQQNRIPMVR